MTDPSALTPIFPFGPWAGDPLAPLLDRPTHPDHVAELSRDERRQRVQVLIEQAGHIIDLAIEAHFVKHELAATCLLWSGGNDSDLLAHLMHRRATHVVMANTGIGVEETREHVRRHAAAYDLTLIEKTGGTGNSFEDFVAEHGFPGPAMHQHVYDRLKGRAFEASVRELGINARKQRVLFLAGRRRSESKRRKTIPLHERVKQMAPVVWVSPLANWTRLDMNTYRQMHPDVPHNPVTDELGMSGECLCGAYAHHGELPALRVLRPDVAAEIDRLQSVARRNGVPERFCQWGHGEGKNKDRYTTGIACGSENCGLMPLFDNPEGATAA